MRRRKRIAVYIIDYGTERNIMMRYRCPITRRQISRSTGTRDRSLALLERDKWQLELNSKLTLGELYLKKGMLSIESSARIVSFRPRFDKGFVYFLHDTEKDWVRIGKSSTPDLTITRLSSERTLISSHTQVLALMRGAENESEVHRLLCASHIRHSWYVLGEEVLFFVRRHCRSAIDRNLYDVVMEIEIDTDHLLESELKNGDIISGVA